MKLFYEEQPEKAKELIAIQILDGWSKLEIEQYFGSLGYDYFWTRQLVDPFFINPS